MVMPGSTSHQEEQHCLHNEDLQSIYKVHVYLRTVLQFCGELDRNASGVFPHVLKVACNIFLKCWGCRLFNSVTFLICEIWLQRGRHFDLENS